MTERRIFQVGGHKFIVDFPEGMLSEKELEPYAPFQTDSYIGGQSTSHPDCPADYCLDEDFIFSLVFLGDAGSLTCKGEMETNLEDENGSMALLTNEDGLMVSLAVKGGRECGRIQISKDYRVGKAWIGGQAAERRFALDTILMLLYTFATAGKETILLHASVVENAGKAYLFLGKSGTGKSTHSRLWIENIEGTELLNDDNPILRIEVGVVYVYGSPWSGKTRCHINRRIPVGGIVRLYQASINRIAPLSGIRGYSAILPSCSCMRWDRGMAEALHSTISEVINKIAVFSLEARPDKASADMCFKALKGG